MRKLLDLILRYRAFLLFLGLEIFCFVLIVNFNKFHSAAYFNSSNAVSGSVHEVTSGIGEYFSLKKGNEQLANHNAELERELFHLLRENEHYKQVEMENELLRKQLNQITKKDSSAKAFTFTTASDSAYINSLNFIAARVIKNEVLKETNYLTINKGGDHGIKKGMGVITDKGVVGKVAAVSPTYASVKSLLHVNNLTSVEVDHQASVLIKKNNILGSLKWEGNNIDVVSMQYVPRHAKIAKGDTIVTSGYNSVYPPGLIIGTIANIELETGATFYDIDVKLATDFSNLYYVYVVDNKTLKMIESLNEEALETENE